MSCRVKSLYIIDNLDWELRSNIKRMLYSGNQQQQQQQMYANDKQQTVFLKNPSESVNPNVDFLCDQTS